MTMPDTILAAMIGHRFGRDMVDHLGPVRMATVRKRNRTYGPGICATHDFCDANMVMHPAFVAISGLDPLDHMEGPDAQRFSDLWGTAWDAAKRRYFT